MEPVKVFLCGGRDAGKTVYLAALLNKFVSPDRQTGLTCDMDDVAYVKKLSAAYNGLREAWPGGTKVVEHHEIIFKFFACVPASSIRHHCANILFYDYAGGIISSSSGPSAELNIRAQQLDTVIKKSDAIAAIVNGEQILESLAKGNLTSQLRHELTMILSKVGGIPAKNTYFMISKWDLFEDNDTTISEIRDLLMRFPPFENWAFQCVSEGHPLRIIPVSSVGPGFVSIVKEDNNPSGKTRMVVNAGVEPTPYNVELLVACILIDRIEFGHKIKAEAMAQYADTVENTKPDWWKRTLHSLADWAEHSPILDRVATQFNFSSRDVQKITAALRDPHLSDIRAKTKAAEEIRGHIKTERDAINYAIAICKDIRTGFEMRYPSATVQTGD